MKNEFNFKTLAEFIEHFKDEQTCREHFTKIRFRNGEYCPHCGHEKIYQFENGKRYRCAKCRKDFTIITGTVFGESKLPLKKWFIAIYLLSTTSKGISSVQLAKHVGVTQKTGWFMDHRIRAAMKQNKGQLFGTIEVDETHIGGLEKNKYQSKRKHVGTGGVGKTALFGLKKRSGEMRAKVLRALSKEELHKAIGKAIALGSAVYTDSYCGYNGLHEGYQHSAVNHSDGQYVDGDVHTNSVESFWALFKRGYHGVYHQMSRKHLQRYVDEFIFRFNRRAEKMREVFSDVVARVSESATLPYKELTS